MLIPGVAWLVLLDTARAMIATSPGPITPALVAARLGQLNSPGETWLGWTSVVLIALIIGYIAKARAMHLATRLPIQLMGTDATPLAAEPRDTQFPYRARHCDKPYFKAIETLTKELTGCESKDLPGPQPFGVVKRLLRLIAPPLWEELEHREAEVRLLGSLFLVAGCSTFLAIGEIVRELMVGRFISSEAVFWLLASVAAALFAGDGFGHLRRREVEYAYLHTLVALNAQERGYWRKRE